MRRLLSYPIRVAQRCCALVRALRARARLRRPAPSPPKPQRGGHLLFFTPEAGVEPHLAAQCVLGRTLQERGHDVLFVRCFDLLRRCPVMDMYGRPYDMSPGERRRLCEQCAVASFSMLDAYGLPVLDLRGIHTQDLRQTAAEAVARAPQDVREFVFDGVAFGKLSAMDLVLARKVSDLEQLSNENRAVWLAYAESSLFAYLLVQRICRLMPVSRLIYFNDYSLLLGARLAAGKCGIPCVSVTLATHRSVDRRQFVLLREPATLAWAKHSEEWPRWRGLALPPERVQEIGEDTLERLRGRAAHAYSPAKTFGQSKLRDRLGLPASKRLLAAYTSSLDEQLATQTTRAGLGCTPPETAQPFPDQIAWLEALTAWVDERDDLMLVVRIHPREGANKRERVSSQHLERLRARFDRPFRNCRFVWPGDDVSSYDLAELADLVLVSWSTIGLELARMGLPVLASTKGWASFPHDDFLEWGATPGEYFAKIDELLGRSASLDTLARAFRWYNLNHLGRALDLGDVVPRFDYPGLPPYRTPMEAQAIDEIIVGGREVLELNRERLERLQEGDREGKEKEALLRYLRRLIRYLMSGDDSAEDYELTWGGKVVGEDAARRMHLSEEGNLLRLSRKGRSWTRESPMCRRAAAFCAVSPGTAAGPLAAVGTGHLT